MEALIPLLIIGAGILYSVFQGNAEQSKNTGRNIDRGKLNNPKRSTRSLSEGTKEKVDTAKKESRGFFGDIMSEIERGMKEFEDQAKQASERAEGKNVLERKRDQFERTKESGRNIARETVERSTGRAEERWNEVRGTVQDEISQMPEINDSIQGEISDSGFKRPERDRTSRNQKVASRAEKLRQLNRADRVQSSVERMGSTRQSITRETAEKNRYQLTDEDLIKHGEIGGYSFKVNRKTVLDGIIFSEILNKPKSKAKSS